MQVSWGKVCAAVSDLWPLTLSQWNGRNSLTYPKYFKISRRQRECVVRESILLHIMSGNVISCGQAVVANMLNTRQAQTFLSRLAVVCNALGSVVVCSGFSWRVGEHHPLVVVSGCEDPCSSCQDCALRGHWGHMLNIAAIIYWQQKVPCSAQWEKRKLDVLGLETACGPTKTQRIGQVCVQRLWHQEQEFRVCWVAALVFMLLVGPSPEPLACQYHLNKPSHLTMSNCGPIRLHNCQQPACRVVNIYLCVTRVLQELCKWMTRKNMPRAAARALLSAAQFFAVWKITATATNLVLSKCFFL